MTLWNPFDLLRAFLPSADAAGPVARRWYRARVAEPELMGDVLRLGGILVAQPYEGTGEPAPIDPYRLAYEAGRRDMALQLTALMGLNIHELNTLLEMNDASAPYAKR